ncbi:MAG TPA: potassium channel family protein [Pseudolabrys sp.]|nr:potassium channel family protein [Pseudolabrys sp.]
MANIAVHASIMGPMSWSAHRTLRSVRRMNERVRLVLVMMAVVTVLMAAHLVEVLIWGLFYIGLEVAPKAEDAFYLAFVNYTTLGYGDILPVAQWRALGPFAAMNGVLLFGWSTAVIFDILRRVTPPPRSPAQR